jgi:hypothetical protein
MSIREALDLGLEGLKTLCVLFRVALHAGRKDDTQVQVRSFCIASRTESIVKGQPRCALAELMPTDRM